MAALEASKRSIKENRVYVGNLAFSVKWNDLKDYMREGGSSLLDSHFLQPSGLAAPPISFAIRRGVGMMGWVDSFMKIGLRRAPGLTWVLSLTSYGCTARPDGQGSFFVVLYTIGLREYTTEDALRSTSLHGQVVRHTKVATGVVYLCIWEDGPIYSGMIS